MIDTITQWLPYVQAIVIAVDRILSIIVKVKSLTQKKDFRK